MQIFTVEQEQRLVEGIKQGDEKAFNEFYSLSLPLMKNILLRDFAGQRGFDADDILQELYAKIWRKMETFQGRCRVMSWVSQMAHRIALDRVIRPRSCRIQGESLDVLLEAGADFAEKPPDADPTKEDRKNKILEIKNCLGNKHLAIFNAVYEQELSVDAAAKKLKLPRGTVLSRTFYLKRKIKSELGV